MFHPPFDNFKLQRLQYEIEAGRKVEVFPKDEPNGAGVEIFRFALERDIMSWELPLIMDLIEESNLDFVSVEIE